MALLCDTRLIPAHLRVAAVNAAMADTDVSMQFAAACPEDVLLQLNCWATGPGSHVLRAQGTASCLSQTDRQMRNLGPRRIAAALALACDGILTVGGTESVATPGHVHLIDQTRPFELRWSGEGGFHVFVVDYERIGLPAALIHAAIPRLRHSMLYDLVRAHLTRLAGVDVRRTELAYTLADAATTELLRALILSTAEHGDGRHETARDLRHVQITMYIEQHLQDTGLGAESIADAHHMSVRQLYKIWARSGEVSLSAWIIAARLEAARRDLSRPRPATVTISAIARRWGFADQAHFSRRFRAAFGMTPGQWHGVHTARPRPLTAAPTHRS